MKRLNIIGCAQGWQDAPSDCECWGITYVVLYRDVDCVFHMHDLNWDEQGWYRNYLRWQGHKLGRNGLNLLAQAAVKQVSKVIIRVNELGIPLYATTVVKGVPTSISYPLDMVVDAFNTRLFTSSADYAVAKAILDGYERIDLYGFNLGSETEHGHQLPSFSHWLGRALGMNVEIHIHGETSVLRSPNGLLYGYNTRQERRSASEK